jgi:ribosomal protein S18 acetylase RimI-like enzyme
MSGQPPVSAENFVRDARPPDAGAIARIQVARWRTGYAGLVPADVLAELTSGEAEGRWQEQWERSLAGPPTSRHRVLVAVTAGDGGARVVAGFASFGPATDPDRWPATDAELYELCAAQDQAERGHGSRLLNAAAATMAEDGFGTVSAWVLERDAAARRFLESSGWAADGTRKELDMGSSVPVIRLHAALSPGWAGPGEAVG